MILKLEPAYIPVVQQKSCCVPCCIQWVLLRRRLPLISQEEIGKMLDLHISPEFSHLFINKFLTTKHTWGGYGTNVTNKTLNTIFKKYKLPLEGEYIHINEIKTPKEFIIKNLRENNDVLVLFTRTGIGQKGGGHMGTIMEFDTATDEVLLGDSSPNRLKKYVTKLDKLIDAMSNKWDGSERGFVIIKEK